MEVIPQPAVVEEKLNLPGCLSELGWFASGIVLPIGSFAFYRKASQRSVGNAILFFFIFTISISVLSTIAFGVPLFGLSRDIRNAFQTGVIPEITIENGIAQVQGPQPIVLINDYTDTGAILVAIDTTGQISSINEDHYAQGILITRTELHILNNGRYQKLPLGELNSLFQRNPLLIDGETVSRAWVALAVIITVLYLIFLILWYSVVRLMFISMIALILWGIGSLFRPKIGFGNFIICGLYAIVPAIYLTRLLGRLDIYFLGLQTILLGLFWLIALVASLLEVKFFSLNNPPRLWTSMIGVPMLILLIIDLFIASPLLYWKIALGSVALLTGFVLVGVRLFFHLRDMRSAVQTIPPSTM